MDASASRYVFLLEDLSPYTLGNQLAGASVSQAKVILDHLAKLHAKFWQGENLATIDWLANDEVHDEEADAYIQEIFGAAWQYLKQQNKITLPESVLAFGDNIIQRGIRKFTDAIPVTLIHGDFRLENMYFDKDEPVIFDWEDIGLAPCTIDLAYFVGGNLPVALSQYDTQLLMEYHKHLLDYGVENYPFDELMAHYRIAMVDSFIQGILTYHNNVENSSSAEFAQAIAARFIARADNLQLADLFD